MVDREQLIRELAEVVGEAYAVHEHADLLVFEYDGSVDKALPLAVVLPASTPEVSEVVKAAARHGVPIDLHMEAVVEELPTPAGYDHSPNPKVLQENIVSFERLLAYNRGARIVWAHAGWGLTGHLTVALIQRLLEGHSNLYMQIRISKTCSSRIRPLDEKGQIRPEWVNLLRSFPDRFIIGSDAKYGGSVRSIRLSLEGPRRFLDQLPPDLARRVGYENARRVYGLATAPVVAADLPPTAAPSPTPSPSPTATRTPVPTATPKPVPRVTHLTGGDIVVTV